MNEKKLDDYFWYGILKELKEDLLEKIEKRLHQLQMIFLEVDPANLVDIKDEPYLYDATMVQNQIAKKEIGRKLVKNTTSTTPKMEKKISLNKSLPDKLASESTTESASKSVMLDTEKEKTMPTTKNNNSMAVNKDGKVVTENGELEKLLKTPVWQCHDYRFLRCFLRVLQFNDYDVKDPLNEDIKEIAKKFVGVKAHKPQHQNLAKHFYVFIDSILENIKKIDIFCKDIPLKELAEQLETDSEMNDIRLFLKLSFQLDQICQRFKEARYEDPNAQIKKDSELWKKLAKKLYKFDEHRLFEYLYTQIENGRNLCIHHSWINESEYQKFANVICLVLSNLKPMFSRLSFGYQNLYRKLVLLQGIYYFTKSLILKINNLENIVKKYFKKRYAFCYFVGNEESNFNAEQLEYELKQDEELKLFLKLHFVISQIYNLLQQSYSSNLLLWKRLENILTLNERNRLKDIYTCLESAKNITLRSLWKNNCEYRKFADTVLLMLEDFKPMLLKVTKNKYFCDIKKQRKFKKKNQKLRKRTIFGRKFQIRQNTAHLWWQLLLIKCSMTDLTTKEHFSDVNPNWGYHLAKRISKNNHPATMLYIRVQNIVTKLLSIYFKYRNKSPTKLHERIVATLKRYKIVSSDVKEENVSDLIETVVKRYFQCVKNLDKAAAWEYDDYEILDSHNLIQSFRRCLHRTKVEINLPGLHDRTPLQYVLSLHDYNPFANMINQKHIQSLIETLLQCGADPDKFNTLTLHPLHYAALISSLFKKWFQNKCVLKNPIDGLRGINPEVFVNHFECFLHDLENDPNKIVERESFLDDSFYNSITIADKIHHSFPNYITDENYYLNLYNEKGQTPLICATDAQYFHMDWKNNLDMIIKSGANVDDEEITAFENGKAIYGENALKKVLTLNSNVNTFGICLSAPQEILNIRKRIVEYMVANGADRNRSKHLPANALFLTVRAKRALQEQSCTSNEKLQNIDQIIEFWFELTVFLHDLQLVEAYQNFHNNFDNWIEELAFGAKLIKSQRFQVSNFQPDNTEKHAEKSEEELTPIFTEDVSKKHIIENEIPSTQFIIFPNSEANLFVVDRRKSFLGILLCFIGLL